MRPILNGVMLGAAVAWCAAAMAQEPFTVQQALSAPFAANMTAAKSGNRVAWTLDEEGKRNIWAAEGPEFTARRVTKYAEDDGGEFSSVKFTEDGDWIVYVRGEGKNSAGEFANPTSNPAGAEQMVWKVRFRGGEPVKIDVGNSPCVSMEGRIAYAKEGQIWLAAEQGEEKPVQLVVRGKNRPVAWAPDGKRLAFVSDRGDHSFIGIYDTAGKSVKFISPSVDSDKDPAWSLEGKHLAFVREPAVKRDTPDGYFIRPDRPHPWAIWMADVETASAREIWRSGAKLEDSYPYMAQDTGGGVLSWAAKETLVFASEQDGWQHLYAVAAGGGAAKLLTPGSCEVEQWSFTTDRSAVVFNSNCGDVERRHIWRVSVAGGSPEELTKGESIEWDCVSLSDGMSIAYFSSDARLPGRPFVREAGKEAKAMIADGEFARLPAKQFVVPQPVEFKAADGLELHGQLFLPRNSRNGEKRPALIFLHGGPVRQMLLGWHYMYYYSNAYGMNQYLANRGYVVLALNYRSGIGYGRGFREAPGRAGRGASEYQDVVAAGNYLRGRADVDARRIGLWGGSYGGLLTALGLARDSAMFAAGVDLHGVHDWPTDNWEGKNIPAALTKLAHESSPVAAVDTWKSPVLFIHGDDDRNVIFAQTVDLVARLRARGVPLEQLVFPDEVHDFLLHGSWVKAYEAAGEFFDRQFGVKR